jgi:hypothetical protein
VGFCIGLFFGLLTWLDAGMLAAGAVVFGVLGVSSGLWMSRRMARFWPGADDLTSVQRVTVVATVRRGAHPRDPALAPAVLDYSRGLHAAAEKGKPWRWLIVVVLLVAVMMALWDAVMGSVGNALASLIYLVLVGLELSWWPNRRAELLTNADRATAMATRMNSAG